MVAAALCTALPAAKAFTGVQVAAKPQRVSCRATHRVQCSALRKEAVAAGVAAATAAALAVPELAQAAVTPSLSNLLNSLVAGGVVLIGIATAVSVVSNFDTIDRK